MNKKITEQVLKELEDRGWTSGLNPKANYVEQAIFLALEEKEKQPRYCGRCEGKDTMLVCCECLRELKEEAVKKKDAEIEKAIKDFEIILLMNGGFKMYIKKDDKTKPFKEIIDKWNELKQKLKIK